ncbi:MAG TPA: hypothetical protein VK923_14120 [Euzebyales bacterium]|nr:hypothetical protein [Euzebyales bacterium]
MDELTAPIDDLIAEATALVEHSTADTVTLALVRDDLMAAVADCVDTATAADGSEVVMALERAMRERASGCQLPLAS